MQGPQTLSSKKASRAHVLPPSLEKDISTAAVNDPHSQSKRNIKRPSRLNIKDTESVSRALGKECVSPLSVPATPRRYANTRLASLHASILRENRWQYQPSSPSHGKSAATTGEKCGRKIPGSLAKNPVNHLSSEDREEAMFGNADYSDEEDQSAFALGFSTPRSLRGMKFKATLATVEENVEM